MSKPCMVAFFVMIELVILIINHLEQYRILQLILVLSVHTYVTFCVLFYVQKGGNMTLWWMLIGNSYRRNREAVFNNAYMM